MTANEKVCLFTSTFRGEVVSNDTHQLEIHFAGALEGWLSEEEKELLNLLGAINIMAYTGGWGNSPYEYTGNLNTACCGYGMFKFEDDETGEETLPIPQPVECMVV